MQIDKNYSKMKRHEKTNLWSKKVKASWFSWIFLTLISLTSADFLNRKFRIFSWFLTIYFQTTVFTDETSFLLMNFWMRILRHFVLRQAQQEKLSNPSSGNAHKLHRLAGTRKWYVEKKLLSIYSDNLLRIYFLSHHFTFMSNFDQSLVSVSKS